MALTWRIQPRSFVYSSLCVGLLLCSLCVTSQSTPVPHGHACLPPNDGFPFCNVTLSVHERVADLIARLTYEDKIGALNDWQGSVDRIGLPDFNFENEGLHGLGGICFSVSNTSGVRCPTTFPIPPTLGASWNDTLLKAVGMAIGTEQRAYNNWGGMRNGGPRPVDLGIWLLNMNLARDARVSNANRDNITTPPPIRFQSHPPFFMYSGAAIWRHIVNRLSSWERSLPR